MKFKLDENFGNRTQEIFRKAGYEAQTVRDEGLSGASDNILYKTCQQEGRCLVTLDLDFANVIRFPPQSTGGIVVIRASRNPDLPTLESLIRQFLQTLKQGNVDGRLWIVETGRIRIHQSHKEE